MFAVVAVVLRRRFGELALLAQTLLVVVAAVAVFKTVPFPDGAFAIPAALVAAAVLEWRAQRHARPAAQVLWTALAFTVVGSGFLYSVAGSMMIVA